MPTIECFLPCLRFPLAASVVVDLYLPEWRVPKLSVNTHLQYIGLIVLYGDSGCVRVAERANVDLKVKIYL